MSKKKEEYNVTVLSRDMITTYPKLGQGVVTVLVTYIAAGLPPHTVRIPEGRFTPENEKTIIRASIKDRLTKKPEAFKV